MEGDTEDEDGLFDLGDDDDQVDDDDVAGELVPIEQQDDLQQQATYPTDEGETLLEALSVREEGAMGNDPYNSEDWDVLAGAEAEAGEVPYDPYDDYGDGMSADGDANDDVNSLTDDGLEEVDEILRTKGRLSYAGTTEGPEVTEPRVSEATGPTAENRTARRPERDSPGSNFPEQSARGTGAQAANTLKSSTAAAAAAAAVAARDVARPLASHPPGGYPTQAAAMASNTPIDLHGTESGQSGARHASASGDNSHFPPRRRANKKPPYIQAKGISLTYAQAKLFGLAGGNEASQTAKGVAAARPRSRQASGKGGSGDRTEKERRYSPSRMEHLARPVPGRGSASAGVGRAGVGGGKGAREGGEGGEGSSFTWKRSRKAEAAMRDPACGYDFVREAGYKREGFLGRMEAYTLYSRVKQETQRAQDLYDTRLDKLECPQCQNPQSYDEFASKKLKCPGCEVTYCMSRTWNRRIWEERDKMRLAKSVERQARAEREVEEEFLRRMPRDTRHAAVLRQRVGQVDFIRRMRRDLQRRRAREESPTKLRQSTTGDDPQQKPAAAAAAAPATSKITRPASAPIGSTKRRTAAPHHVVSRGRRDDNEIIDMPTSTTAPPANQQATEQPPLASSTGEEVSSSAKRLGQPEPRAATTSTTTTTTTTTTAKTSGLAKGASSRPSATTRPASAGERMIATRMRSTRTGSDSRGRAQAKPTPEIVSTLSTAS